MAFSIDSNMQFPLVEVTLERGEQVYIQRGSMVYHTPVSYTHLTLPTILLV